jgi:hypothetical protein
MPRFVRVSRREWQLGGGVSSLKSPDYEQIVRRLCREAKIVAHRRERATRKSGYFRARVIIECSAEAVALFHSARSGYRAQYYSSMSRGERANRFAFAVLGPRIQKLLKGNVKRPCAWWWVERSLLDPSAKLWIHQGPWLRAAARCHRNLLVERWIQAQTKGSRKRRKKAIWSMLTPACETRLEIKGGFLTLSGSSLGSLKERRSSDLHERGFT